MNMNFLHVSAFYKNDKLSGLGITIVNDGSKTGEMIEQYMKSYEAEWNSATEDERKKIVEHYFGQLNYSAEQRAKGEEAKRTQHESVICLMNIWFLEKYGFLESDEYNGCVFFYGQK